MAEQERAEKELPLFRVDSAHERGLYRFEIGLHLAAVAKRFADDAATLTERFPMLAENFDLEEPFARIRGDLRNAERGPMSDPNLDLIPTVRSISLGGASSDTTAPGGTSPLVPDVTTLSVGVGKVGVASLPIRSHNLKVRSFYFPQSGHWREKFLAEQAKMAVGSPAAANEATTAADAARKQAAAALKSSTHIAPPKDIVKLEDRLYYVLQPPLESVFTGGTLDFPFTPFPYQFEGIAFMYPRFAAILAHGCSATRTSPGSNHPRSSPALPPRCARGCAPERRRLPSRAAIPACISIGSGRGAAARRCAAAHRLSSTPDRPRA